MNKEQYQNRIILENCIIPWYKLLFTYPTWNKKYVLPKPKTDAELKEMLELRASLDKMMIPAFRFLIRGR